MAEDSARVPGNATVSPYLERPLRTLAQAEREQSARQVRETGSSFDEQPDAPAPRVSSSA